MTRPRAVITACLTLVATSILLAACGNTGNLDSPEPDMSSAALETEATKMLLAVADHDYAAAYQFRSPRCRIKVPQVDYIASMKNLYDSRDLKTHPPKIIVTASGSSGVVIATNTDPRANEDDPTPRIWTFIDGKWRFDNC